MQRETVTGDIRDGQEFNVKTLNDWINMSDTKRALVSNVPDVGAERIIDGMVYTVTARRMNDKKVEVLLRLK